MLLSLVFWLLAWQVPVPTPPPPPPPSLPLTVLSFNIRYGTANDGENHWTKRREQLFALLRGQQADLVGLQEALHDQLEEIVRAVPGYAYVGVGRSDGRQAGEDAAILYRPARLTPRRTDTFWLSDTPGVVKSTSWGNRIERICTWAYFEDRDGPAFYVYNVHLDHESQPSRERSAELLMRVVGARDPQAPVIVTGDFNSGEDNPAAKLVARTLRDTFRARHPDAAEVGTFNGFTFGNTKGDKIDYIFVEPGHRILAAEILRDSKDGRYPSDHFPVMARVVFSR